MGHNLAGKFHIHFHLQLLTLCYLPSSKPMFYLCFNFQLVFDPTVLKTAKQIIYEESGEDGFVCFLNEPSARWNRYFSSKKKTFYFDPFRGSGYKYMEYVMSAVFPTLYGWMATFNRRVFHQLPTVVLQVSFLVGPDLSQVIVELSPL